MLRRRRRQVPKHFLNRQGATLTVVYDEPFPVGTTYDITKSSFTFANSILNTAPETMYLAYAINASGVHSMILQKSVDNGVSWSTATTYAVPSTFASSTSVDYSAAFGLTISYSYIKSSFTEYTVTTKSWRSRNGSRLI